MLKEVSMAGETVLHMDNLTKQYPNGKKAVDSLTLTVERGEVFGILGPNGSGKTTTILMLLGLTEPTGGQASILGMDPLRSPLQIKRRVGYMPDTVGFYDERSGYDNLDYSARLLNLPAAEREERIRESMGKMGLAESSNEKVRTYSHGMRRRLGLADVLLKQPEIAILDEPTQGLDPESAAEFLDLILYLKREERITILLSSHLLNQVQAVCDRVGLFSSGRMVLSGTFDELASRVFGGRYMVNLRAGGDDLRDAISRVDGVREVEANGTGRYTVECERDIRPALVDAVRRGGGELYELSMQSHTLDSIYKTYFQEAVHAT
jgi:ABC-2 type transport system ATP-binding protein